MKIAVTGANGLIGTPLVKELRAAGHEVIRLVRRDPAAADEVRWDAAAPAAMPVDKIADLNKLAGVEGFIHLAGAGVGDKRWSPAYKAEIRNSRVLGTAAIARVAAALDPKPRVFLCGSAIGWYGDTGDTAVDESAPRGSGFLAEVVEDWEAAAAPAIEAGIRTAYARTGLVVSPDGGAWGKLLPIFKLGGGGKLGSGKQYWSFISLRDEIAALIHILTNDAISGPVNLTAPNPVTNAEATKALGEALNRPALVPVPAFALKAAVGEFSTEILSSARVLPVVLSNSGFEFTDPTIEQATATLVK
jgi:uncharacterized protein (TIGR01777 family)